MKKTIKISSFLIVVIGVLIASFSFGYTYLKNEKEKYSYLIAQINENCNELYSSDMYRKQELYYNGKVLSWVVRVPDAIVSEELDKSLNEDKLVLLFSESTCSQCVEAELKNINRKMKQLRGKVIIIIKSDNKRYVSQFRINNKLEYPCFRSLNTNDSLMIDMPPFYFVVEKN